jgi:hypothetical protein
VVILALPGLDAQPGARKRAAVAIVALLQACDLLGVSLVA